MSKATEEDLATLHGAVARALTAAIKPVTTVKEIDGEEVTIVTPPSASHLMAAITMLKNNNVTADLGSNADLQDLTKALQERRQAAKRRLSAGDIDAAAAEFDKHLGGHLQ